MSQGKNAPTLPPLDMAAIKAEAREWVDDQLAGVDAPDELIRATTAIITAETDPYATARKRRDETAISIREYGPDATTATPKVVRNVRLAEAAGISRPRLQVLRQQLPEGRAVKLVRNAREVLPKVATAAALHAARIEYALELRDEAITRLIRLDWSNVEIARLMDRDPSRAAHLRFEVKVLDAIEAGYSDERILREVLEVDPARTTSVEKALERIASLRKRPGRHLRAVS